MARETSEAGKAGQVGLVEGIKTAPMTGFFPQVPPTGWSMNNGMLVAPRAGIDPEGTAGGDWCRRPEEARHE